MNTTLVLPTYYSFELPPEEFNTIKSKSRRVKAPSFRMFLTSYFREYFKRFIGDNELTELNGLDQQTLATVHNRVVTFHINSKLNLAYDSALAVNNDKADEILKSQIMRYCTKEQRDKEKLNALSDKFSKPRNNKRL